MPITLWIDLLHLPLRRRQLQQTLIDKILELRSQQLTQLLGGLEADRTDLVPLNVVRRCQPSVLSGKDKVADRRPYRSSPTSLVV